VLGGAKIIVREHFDRRKELICKKRKLIYSVTVKHLWWIATRSMGEWTKRWRNTGHKPAEDHPWRKMPIGESTTDRRRVVL